MGDGPTRAVGTDRREFLAGMAGLAAAAATGAVMGPAARTALAEEPAKPAAGAPASPQAAMILREREPLNVEFPFGSLTPDARITPTERFFIRSHFAIPEIDPKTWRLKVEGAVNKPVELTLADIAGLPSQPLEATLECAGNGRVYLSPRPRGLLWEQGAVGNAEWTGPALSQVLELAGGAKPSAVEVVFEGADKGEVRDDPKTPGVVHYSRGVPMAKAASVRLAHSMNGGKLTPAHGFPLRAVVPGWYGMASVKWLTRIIVVEKPYGGYYQTADYSRWERSAGLAETVPVTEMQVKSSIARPALGEVVAAGKAYPVFGAAWAGESAPVKVEFSADGGKTWAEAKLRGEAKPYVWRTWETTWTPPAPGRYTLMSRATDGLGRTQPEKHDPDRRTYMINFTAPVEIEAR
jgi:DMSO/TMAO reductase YedYZ molybdopterin-dependent catalytic subunit